MDGADPGLELLRQALAATPDNRPLRQHLASALAGRGEYAAAEALLKEGLRLSPSDEALKLDLARTYQRQLKYSAAFVVVEDLIKHSSHPAAAYVRHAWLLLATDEPDRAAREYRKALAADPDAADRDLAERLGVGLEDEAEAEVQDGRLRARTREPLAGGGGSFALERPTLTFADVGGMEELKEEVRLKIIHPLTHPELYRAYGKAIGGGILMYGPPGCGKTQLARATAGEVDASFLAVGIDDVLDMWIGQSEKNLHALFELARAKAPCVLFFDEVDALGANRADMRHSSGRHVINQFLAELDGVGASNEGVLVLAATNAPWHLDAAFRRPGRFDRVVFVPPPDRPARAAILQVLCRDKPTRDVDWADLAKRSDGFSGADLQAVVDRAVEAKLRQALEDGIPKPLVSKDLKAALGAVKPSTREWFATARNYVLYANQGGIYDDLLPYVERR